MEISRKKSALVKAYKNLFLNEEGDLTPDAEIVFEDWINFARVKKGLFDRSLFNNAVEVEAGLIREGRREFFNRIWTYLEMDFQEVYKKRNKLKELAEKDREDAYE